MLKRNFQLRYEVERLIDASIAFLSLTLAIMIRRNLAAYWFPGVFPLFDFWPEAGWLYILLIAIWLILFDVFDIYSHRSAHTPIRTLGILVRVNLVGIMLAFFMFYILRIQHIPRALILLYAAINFAAMWAKEMILWYGEPRWQKPRNLLLVGEPDEFADFVQRILASRSWSQRIVGMLTPGVLHASARASGGLDSIPILGSTADLPRILHEQSIDYVVLNPSHERFTEIQQIITTCETEGVETWLLGSFFKTSIARAQVDEFQDLPMLIFSTTPAVSWALILKRLIDLVGGVMLIVLTAPIMAGAVLAIKLTSPGPAIFRQRRCTLHGRQFWMYKFRTMVTEAEQLRAELTPLNEMSGPVFKMKNDPRVTSVGRFLRRYSIDELPQLINVLRGEMSLVGPRPPIPSEVKDYEGWHRRRLSMRPGLTCLWQTAGRNALPFEDWMKMDLQYIDNWSLGLDLRILVKTPLAIVRGTGV